MGHRYYIWAIPKMKKLPYIAEEIKRAFDLALPKFKESNSPLALREIKLNKNRSLISFQISRSEKKRYTDYDRQKDQFSTRYISDWHRYFCYWDVERNYIEIRGGKDIQEDIFNELVSIFKTHFEFKPLNICNEAFNFIINNRISNITDKEDYLKDGYAKVGGVCLNAREFTEFQKYLKKRRERGKIIGLYSFPKSSLIDYILEVPIFLDQAGKIRFFKFQKTKNRGDIDFYEEITRKIVEDIINIISKKCAEEK